VAVVTLSFSRKSFSICPTRIRRLWVFFWPVIWHSLCSTMRTIYAKGLPGSLAALWSVPSIRSIPSIPSGEKVFLVGLLRSSDRLLCSSNSLMR
jgi:hypothetical protein